MKQQLITFFLDYQNSRMNFTEFAVSRNMDLSECKILLSSGCELNKI